MLVNTLISTVVRAPDDALLLHREAMQEDHSAAGK